MIDVTDVSVTLRPPRWCPSEGHQHGVSIQSSINLGETLNLKLMARSFVYQSFIRYLIL